MSSIEENKPELPVEKKKTSFGRKFVNFLMMGGFMLVLIVALGAAIGISMALKSC